jgi:hypothetical protein
VKTREDSGPFSETDLRGNEHGVFAAKSHAGLARRAVNTCIRQLPIEQQQGEISKSCYS